MSTHLFPNLLLRLVELPHASDCVTQMRQACHALRFCRCQLQNNRVELNYRDNSLLEWVTVWALAKELVNEELLTVTASRMQ
eukprot:1353723-Lingulodinium_polyedra.AAC.1